ncbi:MAG: IS110 family transposase [Candidatus Faecousia sp.]|nr:IS110 family transposase [Candidatus Faecousia sp.]
MTSITYIGMDVHTTNFTLCCYSFEDDKVYAAVQVKPEYTEILKYINRVRKQRGEDTRFVCGYEAGCLGYSLYHKLTDHGVECVILAPSTMAETPGKKIKTDKRDAEKIARCLAYHQYKPVYVPDEEDDAVKEYIRMRDDVKAHLKETKQQIIAYYTRHGFQFDGSSHWTQKHLNWVESLQFENSIHQEVLREYLTVFYDLSEKVAVYDARIEELSHSERYAENVGKLCCFSGIATHTALSLLAEVGDFSRFRSAPQFAAYLGLVPGEHSSSDKQHRTGITKAGNSHLRRLLIESAHCYSRGAVGKKSKAQKERQAGNSPEVIAYADRAVDRLKRKYQRIALHSRANIAKTAVARELACFVWGMMTGNISATALH